MEVLSPSEDEVRVKVSSAEKCTRPRRASNATAIAASRSKDVYWFISHTQRVANATDPISVRPTARKPPQEVRVFLHAVTPPRFSSAFPHEKKNKTSRILAALIATTTRTRTVTVVLVGLVVRGMVGGLRHGVVLALRKENPFVVRVLRQDSSSIRRCVVAARH